MFSGLINEFFKRTVSFLFKSSLNTEAFLKTNIFIKVLSKGINKSKSQK